jgi:hypothetical protein
MTDTKTYLFHEVFAEEVQAINQRREALHGKGHRKVALESEGDTDVGPAVDPSSKGGSRVGLASAVSGSVPADVGLTHEPIMRPTEDSRLVGLALSGGGIRSASFCLGALQALDKAGVLDNIDYLSTVSGGGYIGASLSAGMTCSRGKFPFKSSLSQNEPLAVQHIRDHSNYLFPSGIINISYNVVVYLRGLVANALLILPWLLFAAAITILANPTVAALNSSVLWTWLPTIMWSGPFAATLIVLYFFTLVLLAWSLIRGSGAAEIGSWWTRVCAWILLGLLLLPFLELQPVILSGLFEWRNGQTSFLAGVAGSLQNIAAVLAPFSAAIALFSRHIGRLLKQGGEKPTLSAAAMRVLGKVAVYIAGAAVPFLLWMAYLYLSFIGIRDYAGVQNYEFLNGYGSYYYHTPLWLRTVSEHFFGYGTHIFFGYGTCIMCFYFVVGVLLLVLSIPLSPNGNSLHRLYRDRLSKAFLFDPCHIVGRKRAASWFAPGRVVSMPLSDSRAAAKMASGDFDLGPLDGFKLSKINCIFTPYHLINTALNIQGSKYANRRSRNADFFMFSPKFIGSHATRYVHTQAFEDRVAEADLATAMAVSGAAASSNMGANSIKALAPTLAILNIRLGYWLPNPRQIAKGVSSAAAFSGLRDQLYFLREMLAGMREDSEIIYLTDGGHIENLGIYELLRRRCQLIVAIDAEADPEMSFGSLITLQRYARIDLGIIINLPWATIRDGTRSASAEIAKSGGLPPHAAPHGPHCAVGEIQYPHGRKGILIYVKSSLSGDENDCIVDYKRRFPSYPHETTADQLFSEEQFEAYRALGFHAVNELFSGSDQVGMRPKPARWQGDVLLNEPLVEDAKDMLKWK